MRGGRGFTLVEMVVVIAVLGVLFTILIGITRAVVTQQRYQLTRSRIANVDTALAVYVSQYKRLPCPADGTKASSISAAGTEVVTGSAGTRDCGSQQNGVVPWRELGLTASDIEDGWGGRLTFRVGPDLVKDGALDFSSCDPAGGATAVLTTPPYCSTACIAGNLAACTPPLVALTGALGKGLVVENATNTVVMDPRTNPTTGAAYVLVSHGAEGGGAYTGNGTLLSSTTAASTAERKNFANLAYALPPATGAPTAFFVDDASTGPGTSHFDDFVSRPGVLTLAVKAQLGPRSH